MLLHSMISIRDNSSLGTFHKTWINKEEACQMGSIVSPLCCCVSVMCALYDENHLHKKTCCFCRCDWPSLVIDCDNRSVSDRSSGTQERGTKDNPVLRLEAFMAPEHGSLAPEYADHLVTSSITNQVFGEGFFQTSWIFFLICCPALPCLIFRVIPRHLTCQMALVSPAEMSIIITPPLLSPAPWSLDTWHHRSLVTPCPLCFLLPSSGYNLARAIK